MILVPSDRKIDFSLVPKTPGCYIYKNKEQEIIYIGKAKNLTNRIRSYFSHTSQHSLKTKHLVERIYCIEWIVVDNEVEALLLENTLIKKHKPKYNIDLKDAKTFAYIKITNDAFPRILSTRKVTKDGMYFGPYTDGSLRVQLIRTVVSIFKLRTCKALPKRACLNYHIGICTAPCIQQVTQESYATQVKRACDFLRGNIADTVALLQKEMELYAKELKFEKALERKKQLEAIAHLFERQKVEHIKNFDQDIIALVQHNDEAIFEIFTVKKGVISGKTAYRVPFEEHVFEEFLKRYYSTRTPPYEIIVNKVFYTDEQEKGILEAYFSKLRTQKVIITCPQKGDKRALLALAEKNAYSTLEENKALLALQEALHMAEYPKVIECFDISNLAYDHIVAGMVRFVDGQPDKAGYRKFKIQSVSDKNDDFASMEEVIFRRYSRIKRERGEYPDLIIVDGGLGQLGAALKSLRALGLQIPIIGLAKENEEIYTPSEPTPLQFDKNSKMMLLLRQIRDSVHDFALGYNRKRRQMRLREEFGALK